jgi:hypothetical protein
LPIYELKLVQLKNALFKEVLDKIVGAPAVDSITKLRNE